MVEPSFDYSLVQHFTNVVVNTPGDLNKERGEKPMLNFHVFTPINKNGFIICRVDLTFHAAHTAVNASRISIIASPRCLHLDDEALL